jgi:hypothetical protein
MPEEYDEYYDEDDDLEDFDLEEEAEDSLRDLVRKVAEEEGYDLAFSEEEYEELLEKVYAECRDEYVSLAYEYSDIEEAEEDDDLLDQIHTAFSQLEEDHKEYLRPEKKAEYHYLPEEEEEDADSEPAKGFSGMGVLTGDRPSRSRSGYLDRDSSVYYSGRSRSGYARRSLIDDEVVKYYDHKGKPIGYSMPSLTDEETVNYYIKGELAGYSRPSLLSEGVTNYYDRKGKYLGCSRKSLLDEDFENYYWKKK